MGNFELIKALIAKNVSLTSLSEETGQNCAMVALQSNKKELIFKMSDYFVNGKPFNQQDRDIGETIIMKAIQKRDIDVVKYLLESKAGIILGQFKDKSGKNEIIHACEINNTECVRLLINYASQSKQDLDMNHYDKRGRTALIHATINQNADILNLILNKYEFPFLSTSQTNNNYSQLGLTASFSSTSLGSLPQSLHVIKWKDELGKDACDYAHKDEVKKMLGRYIEKHGLVYPGYFNMMRSIQIQIANQRQKESYLQKIEREKKAGIVSSQRAQLDLKHLKEVQKMASQREKTTKNKLKKIEDEINKLAEIMVNSEETAKEQAESEKLAILQQFSKKRLKQLQSIAIRFPKLTNLEHNPKFKQAINQLYKDSDLNKYISGDKKRSIEQILESHSPLKVIRRRRGEKKLQRRLTLSQDRLIMKQRLQLPSI